MSLRMARDLLIASGYEELGRPLEVGGVDLGLEVLTGQGSSATLVILWDSPDGYGQLRRRVLALRSLLSHSISPRPMALIVSARLAPLPAEIARLVRVYVLPDDATVDQIKDLLSGLMPLTVQHGELAELNLASVVGSVMSEPSVTSGLTDELVEAASDSRDAVEDLLIRFIEQSVAIDEDPHE